MKKSETINLIIKYIFEEVEFSKLLIFLSLVEKNKLATVRILMSFGLYLEAIDFVKAQNRPSLNRKFNNIIERRMLYKFSLFMEALVNSGLDKNDFIVSIEKYSLFLNKSNELNLARLSEIDANKSLSHFIDVYAYDFNNNRSEKIIRNNKRIKLPILSAIHLWSVVTNNGFRSLEYKMILSSKDTASGDKVFKRLIKDNLLKDTTISNGIFNKMFSFFSFDEMEEYISNNNIYLNQFQKISMYRVLAKQKIQLISKAKKIEKPRVAICISGQLRGVNTCLPKLISQLENISPDYFVSTWDKVGYPSGAHANKLARLIPKDLRYIVNGVSDLEFYEKNPKIEEYIKTNSSSETLLCQLTENIDCKVQIINENEFGRENNLFNLEVRLANQYKMFKQISLVLELLAEFEQVNKKKYDYILWLRPDLEVKSINIMALANMLSNNEVFIKKDYALFLNRKDGNTLMDIEDIILQNKNKNNLFGDNVGPKLLSQKLLFDGLTTKRFPDDDASFGELTAPVIDRDFLIESLKESTIVN